MNELLNYRGFSGSVEFSKEDNVFYGKLLGIKGLVLYEGDTIDELIQGFREMTDEYIDFCERNDMPLPMQDKTSVFVKLETYRQAVETAQQKGIAWEEFADKALRLGTNQLKAS